MKDNVKKMLVLVMAIAMTVALCACGSKESEEETGMANPIIIVADASELTEATGISLDAPEGATDVAYAYCQPEDGTIEFAQVTFTLDGNEFCYRAKDSGDITEITASSDENASTDDLMSALENGTNIGAELAGMNYEWNSAGTVVVQERAGVCAFNKKGPGFIAWLDVAPGFLYSLSMDDNATQDVLTDVANKSFVPMQGEVE